LALAGGLQGPHPVIAVQIVVDVERAYRAAALDRVRRLLPGLGAEHLVERSSRLFLRVGRPFSAPLETVGERPVLLQLCLGLQQLGRQRSLALARRGIVPRALGGLAGRSSRSRRRARRYGELTAALAERCNVPAHRGLLTSRVPRNEQVHVRDQTDNQD